MDMYINSWRLKELFEMAESMNYDLKQTYELICEDNDRMFGEYMQEMYEYYKSEGEVE